MAHSKVEADQTSRELMHVINQTINEFTGHTPLSVEQIVICLGYITGRAIGHIEGRNPRRIIRETVCANMDAGIATTVEKNGTAGIIMPTVGLQ